MVIKNPMHKAIGDEIGHPADELLYEPDKRWALSKCKVGLELEVERFNYSLTKLADENEDVHTYWIGRNDESLRAVDGVNPIELVFRQPLYGADLTRALQTLHFMLSTTIKNGGDLVFSHRTSVHIHIDVRNLSVVQLFNFIALYVLLEELIYYYIGENRDKCIFALPMYAAEGSVFNGIMLASMEGAGTPKTKQIAVPGKKYKVTTLPEWVFCSSELRYLGCNLASIHTHGSLEFRHMAGTDNVEAISKWINILLCLKRKARDFRAIRDIFTADISPTSFAYIVKDILHTEQIYAEFINKLPEHVQNNLFGASERSIKLAAELYNRYNIYAASETLSKQAEEFRGSTIDETSVLKKLKVNVSKEVKLAVETYLEHLALIKDRTQGPSSSPTEAHEQEPQAEDFEEIHP